MRKPITNLFLFFTSCLILFIALQGCTIAGYYIGKGMGTARDHIEVIPVEQLALAQEGDSVRVILSDSRFFIGTFEGVRQKSAEEYGIDYEKFINSQLPGKYYPTLGDSTLISTTRGLNQWLIFNGFDYSYLWLISIKDETLLSVQYETIKQISGKSNSFLTGEELSRLANEGSMPVMTSVQFKIEEKEKIFPPSEISLIEFLPQKNRAKIIGLFIGLGLDALIIYSLSSFKGPDYWEMKLNEAARNQ